MLPLASLFNDAATGAGFMAASIAVGGFLGHAQLGLAGGDDLAVKAATVRGGLWGLAFSAVISAAALLAQ